MYAQVIIDATERANVARMAGATFNEYPSGTQKFRRVVVGGAAREGKGLRVVQRPTPLVITDRKGEVFPVHEYEIDVPMRNGGFGSVCRGGTACAGPDVVAGGRGCCRDPVPGAAGSVPELRESCGTRVAAWPGAEKVPLECFQPERDERIFALGGCADLSREAAAALLRPVNQMAVGARIGQAAAVLAARQSKPEGVRVAVNASAVARPVSGTAAYHSRGVDRPEPSCGRKTDD